MNPGSASAPLPCALGRALPYLAPGSGDMKGLDQSRPVPFQLCHWDPARGWPYPRTLALPRIQAIGARPGGVSSLPWTLPGLSPAEGCGIYASGPGVPALPPFVPLLGGSAVGSPGPLPPFSAGPRSLPLTNSLPVTPALQRNPRLLFSGKEPVGRPGGWTHRGPCELRARWSSCSAFAMWGGEAGLRERMFLY